MTLLSFAIKDASLMGSPPPVALRISRHASCASGFGWSIHLLIESSRPNGSIRFNGVPLIYSKRLNGLPRYPIGSLVRNLPVDPLIHLALK